jgi:hypothetical protein
MERRILNWHHIADAEGKSAWLAVFECGHLWQMHGQPPPALPTRGECGVCAAEEKEKAESG